MILLICLGNKAFSLTPEESIQLQAKMAESNSLFKAVGDGTCFGMYAAASIYAMTLCIDYLKPDANKGEQHKIFELALNVILMITSIEQAKKKLENFSKNLTNFINEYSSAKVIRANN